MTVRLSNVHQTWSDANTTYVGMGLHIDATGYAADSSLLEISINNDTKLRLTPNGSLIASVNGSTSSANVTPAFNQANSAYNQANNAILAVVGVQSNTSSAYNQANIAWLNSRSSYNTANISLSIAQTANAAINTFSSVISIEGRLGGPQSKQITDWNSANQNGWYMAQGAANSPIGASDWLLSEVVAHNPIWITQTGWAFVTSNSTNTMMYRRSSSDSGGGNRAWGPWYKLAVSEEECGLTAWNSSSVTPGATGGGSYSNAVASIYYKKMGKTLHFELVLTLTDIGTATGYPTITMPIASKSTIGVYFGREAIVGVPCLAVWNSSTDIVLVNLDNSSPLASGRSIRCCGTYEVN